MRLSHYLYTLCLMLGGAFLYAEETDLHQFKGYELQANYYDCDVKALEDVETLARIMELAVNECGATILKTAEHRFEPMGFTMMLLLSESHASIHTYPEKGACFIDLFTCGENCSAERFDAVLRAYLKPTRLVKKMYIRDEDGIAEIDQSFPQPEEKIAS